MNPQNIFYIRGARENFENIVVPCGTTKIVHVLGRLKTLKGIHLIPDTVDELDVSCNMIYSIEGIEKTNIKKLKLNGNYLENLKDITYSQIEILKIKGNPCYSEFENCGHDINVVKEKYKNDGFDIKQPDC